jgi:osmotically inducible protein OsmC
MERTAKAHWSGNLKNGKGTLTTQSGILDKTNYSFKTRFEQDQKGTNPEELLAAAHAGCFTMAVSNALSLKKLEANYLDTNAIVTMENLSITKIHLVITGSIIGISEDEFKAIVNEAEKNCIISKALNVPISSESFLTK